MRFLLSVLFLILLFPTSSFAQKAKAKSEVEKGPVYICTMDVFYIWAKKQSPNKKLKTRYIQLKEVGNKPDYLKTRLTRSRARYTEEAIKACRKRHGSPDSCIVNKMKVQGNSLHELSFEERSVIIDKAHKLCRNSVGICMDSYVAEVACAVKRT